MANEPKINRFDINTEGGRKRENTISGTLLHKTGLIVKLVISLFFIFSGIVLMVGPFFAEDDPLLQYYLAQSIDEFIAIGLTCLVYYFFFKPRIYNTFVLWTVTLISYFILEFICTSIGHHFVTGLQLITGFFGLFTCLVLFLNVARQIRDHVNFLRSLVWGLIYGLTGLDLILGYQYSYEFTLILGFYIFTFAFSIFWEALKSLFSFSNKKRETRRRMTTLPTVVSAFLPIGFFANLTSTVNREDYDKNLFLEEDSTESEEEKTDLTIYIHTRAGLMPGFGHVDISFDGKVYCYGNYDEDTWLFGGFLSDGVLATTTPENHIKNALTNDKKVLVAYDLKISEQTKKEIQKQIDKMMTKAYRWRPKAELAAIGEIEGNPEDYTDVASKMYLEENTELYKFGKGSPYKTYYLLGQNCAMVANEIVGKSGIKLLRLNRIVTPGSYLEYLDQLYKMRHTIVVDRNIYMLNNNGKPYLLTPENEQELTDQIIKKN